jgi:Ion channel/Pentapeptide repeats (8 copies)
MASDELLTLLKQGSAIWNKWLCEQRAANERFRPDLEMANLSGWDLGEANLSKADLGGADLSRADLTKAELNEADLNGAKLNYADLGRSNLQRAMLQAADLSAAQLSRADLSMAYLGGAKLSMADLQNANLSGAFLLGAKLDGALLEGADFSRANLEIADISGATVRRADFTEAQVTSIRWDPARMRGKYQSIRGIDSCYGNALFKRAAADQDFLDTLEDHWGETWRRFLFRAWGWLDFGRSMSRVAAFGFGVATSYGAIFSTWRNLLDFSGSANTWFTPFYFSIVTFTTLGFGDVKPKSVIGELLASSEVIVGYITLGLLLAVLAEKLARRS